MRWTHSLPVLDKFSVVDTLVLDNLVLLDRSSDKDCDLNLVLPVDLSGGLYEALLVDDDQERSFGGEPFERLYGIWMKSILAKTNLDYVSGYSFVGPDYLYKDKSRNLIPCEIKWKTGGLMTAIGQLTGYIRQFNAPFGILVRAGTFHPSWLYQWRMVRGAWPEEQLEKIIFLLL